MGPPVAHGHELGGADMHELVLIGLAAIDEHEVRIVLQPFPNGLATDFEGKFCLHCRIVAGVQRTASRATPL